MDEVDEHDEDKRVGRRRLLRGLGPMAADGAARALGTAVAASLPEQRRPPGAVEEVAFLSLCTRCDACIDACPHGAILYFNEQAGPLLARTPVMRQERRPCHVCPDAPCIAACNERALRPLSEGQTIRLGLVRVRTDRCIAYLGPECGACVGMCPDGISGLRLASERPVVDRDQCIGCGLCIHACPVEPAAIEVAE